MVLSSNLGSQSPGYILFRVFITFPSSLYFDCSTTFLPLNVSIAVQAKFHVAFCNPRDKALVTGVWQVEWQNFRPEVFWDVTVFQYTWRIVLGVFI